MSGAHTVEVDSRTTQMDRLDALAKRHCVEHGYAIVDLAVLEDGYRTMSVHVPDKDGVARLAYDGEVFTLLFPGGYSWAGFAYCDEDRDEAFADVLAFLDAYGDPDTHEVTVQRRLRSNRRELRVSNGAVLRARGWSLGPPS